MWQWRKEFRQRVIPSHALQRVLPVPMASACPSGEKLRLAMLPCSLCIVIRSLSTSFSSFLCFGNLEGRGSPHQCACQPQRAKRRLHACLPHKHFSALCAYGQRGLLCIMQAILQLARCTNLAVRMLLWMPLVRHMCGEQICAEQGIIRVMKDALQAVPRTEGSPT